MHTIILCNAIIFIIIRELLECELCYYMRSVGCWQAQIINPIVLKIMRTYSDSS